MGTGELLGQKSFIYGRADCSLASSVTNISNKPNRDKNLHDVAEELNSGLPQINPASGSMEGLNWNLQITNPASGLGPLEYKNSALNHSGTPASTKCFGPG